MTTVPASVHNAPCVETRGRTGSGTTTYVCERLESSERTNCALVKPRCDGGSPSNRRSIRSRVVSARFRIRQALRLCAWMQAVIVISFGLAQGCVSDDSSHQCTLLLILGQNWILCTNNFLFGSLITNQTK